MVKKGRRTDEGNMGTEERNWGKEDGSDYQVKKDSDVKIR